MEKLFNQTEQDKEDAKIKAEAKRLGYEINLITRNADNEVYVLAENEKEYVTWYWTGTGFVHGHYFFRPLGKDADGLAKAARDLSDRLH